MIDIQGETAVAEIINLRQARKRKARETKERSAAANRAKFGTSKATHRLHDAQNSLLDKKLNQALRADSDSTEPD